MPGLAISLNLRGQKAVVVGNGAAAARKAERLIACEARVLVIAEHPGPEVLALGGVTLLREPFRADHLDGAAVVIAENDDPGLAEAVAAAARQRGIPVNVIDCPALCDFTMPALVERGRITVAISTDGGAPLLARMLRARIEAALPPGLGALADLAARWRKAVAAHVPSGAARRRFWEWALQGPPAEAMLAGRADQASQMLTRAVADEQLWRPTGLVSVVGFGPGDPDLLTMKALRRLQEADIVAHEDDLPPAILALARRDAERLVVTGKTRAALRRQLENLVREGRRVVLLRAGQGDPAEAAALVARGIAAEGVPGVISDLGRISTLPLAAE